MNVDYDNEETDRILVEADIADEHGLMPEKALRESSSPDAMILLFNDHTVNMPCPRHILETRHLFSKISCLPWLLLETGVY